MLKLEDIKDRVQPRFINMENPYYLSRLAFEMFLNMSVAFCIEENIEEDRTRCIMLSRAAERELAQDSVRLFEQALKNISLNDICLHKLCDLAGIPKTCVDDMEMYVLTNEKRIQGSICILLKDVRERIVRFFGESVYVIPSSCHELILAPVSKMEFSSDELCKMVKEINRTLYPMDVLSDSIYLLNRDAELSVVA